MAFPLLAIQQSVYATLNGDATLQNLVNGIYDQPPEEAGYPFVRIESLAAADWSFSGGEGVRAEIVLATYSRYHGKSETLSMLSRMHDVLHDAPISVSGYRLVQSRVISSQVRALADGKTTRGDMVVELLVY